MKTPSHPSANLVFVGIKGSVVALDATSGEQVWATHLMGGDFVNVVANHGRLYATTNGEIFCLNASTGEGLWHNRLKGFGRGLAVVACGNEVLAPPVTALAEHQRRVQAAATASAATAVC